jgi:hypothetical protein
MNEIDDDRPLTPVEQAAHFCAAASRSNTKLVTILRADLERALAGPTPANEFTEYARAKAAEAAGNHVTVIRSKLLHACRSIVAAAEESDANDPTPGTDPGP